MAQFTFGPVEFYLVRLREGRPSPTVVAALVDLIDSGVVRLLDLLIIERSPDGIVTVTDVEEEPEHFGFGDVEFAAIGLAGDEDVEELADLVEPGTTAGLVVFELAWARRLAEKVAAAGDEVLSVERIPAPVVNALIDAVLVDES